MRRKTNLKPRAARIPEGAAWSALTLILAAVILLSGYLLTVWLDDWLPSGKNVLLKSELRNPLDESWMQSTPSSEPLGIFPYDTTDAAELTAMDNSSSIPAETGFEQIRILSDNIARQWYSSFYSSQHRIKMAMPYDYKDEGLALVYAATDISDADPDIHEEQYVGVLKAPMPGLSFPDRWIMYRIPTVWLLDADNEQIVDEYRADAVYHPALGLVHFFLHLPQESFPSAFTRADDDAPLQFVKAQGAGVLEYLLQIIDSGSVIPDKAVDAAWQSKGNTSLADLRAITSSEPDGCYVADGLFAVSFPCKDGGRIYLYLEAATMNLRGFSRVFG